MTDISDLKHSAESLRRSVREREVLLAEVHHRVKNNLQVISSMLSLQGELIEDPSLRDVLSTSRLRIDSMSLVHSLLYDSANFDGVPFHHYVNDLLAMLAGSHDAGERRIVVTNHADAITLTLSRAVPLALIVTELTSNAFKHAFPAGRTGSILVELQSITDANTLRLTVSDNGVGFPAVEAEEGPGSSGGMGLTIVEALAAQLGGTVSIVTEGGTRAVVDVPTEL